MVFWGEFSTYITIVYLSNLPCCSVAYTKTTVDICQIGAEFINKLCVGKKEITECLLFFPVLLCHPLGLHICIDWVFYCEWKKEASTNHLGKVIFNILDPAGDVFEPEYEEIDNSCSQS